MYRAFTGTLRAFACSTGAAAQSTLRARGDAVWLTVLDEDDVPSIARYRITR